jgi:hypothetical protein
MCVPPYIVNVFSPRKNPLSKQFLYDIILKEEIYFVIVLQV